MTPTWATARLGDVLRTTTREEPVDRSATYRLLGVRLDGKGPFLREEKAGAAISATKLASVQAGGFIYSRLFAWRGAFGVIPPELDGCHVSGEFPTFAAVPERLDLNFLRYWFRLPETLRSVEAWCSGSTPLTRNRLKEERFLALEVPLPPLAEQRQIVARIKRLAAKVSEAQEISGSAAKASASVVDAELDRVFIALSATSQGTVIEDSGGYVTSGPRGWGKFYSEHGTRRLVRVENVNDRRVDLSIAARVSLPLGAGDVERSQIKKGDVLVTITGAIGRVGVVTGFDLPCHVSQHVALIRPPKGLCPEYLYWFLRCPKLGRSQTEGKTYGATKPGINLTSLWRLAVITPPLAEQRRIVAYLDDLQAKVDSLKDVQEKTAAELDALMPSILDKAFRGEL